MQIAEEIDLYIQRISKDYGLSITLHPCGNEQLISKSNLIKYNIHSPGYCLYLKSNPAVLEKCIRKQQNIAERLAVTDRFTGVCHAGVKERVYGIYDSGRYMGFISVSGYQADASVARPRIDHICEEFCFPRLLLNESYSKLSRDFPDEALLDSLVIPLCRMIEYGNFYMEQTSKDLAESLYIKILRYINANFCREISVGQLAEKFSVSPSQISHTFKRMNGKSIAEYVAFLRIELAKSVLCITPESITNIAIMCGFSDHCYFSNVFRRLVGMSPAKYRQKFRKKESSPKGAKK